MKKNNSKIFVAGHNGMVGSSVVKFLRLNNYNNLLLKTRNELDLTNFNEVEFFFKNEKPEIVIDCAAMVGGILANDNYPYDFLLKNMKIQNNLIEISKNFSVKKFIFLGSSCIYPKFAEQPISEDSLLTSQLEKTNEAYALAKITGVKLCSYLKKHLKKDFVSLMPCNLYGINDNFDPESSHVIPGMINKFHEAKANSSDVILWGTGNPLREFLFVDDLAKIIIKVMESEKINESIYNVGSGIEISIAELAILIAKIVDFSGKIIWDNTKPDGTPRKIMDSSKLISQVGSFEMTELEDGLIKTYEWFKLNESYIKKNADKYYE
jgi:GDP-L-fucose synthase